MAYNSARRMTIMFGGEVGSHEKSGETWGWDGETWTLLAETGPSPRTGHGMAFDSARERIVLFGGWDDQEPTDETWEWDGSQWQERIVQSGPSGRYMTGMAYDDRRQVTVLFGGWDVDCWDSQIWEWNGSAWTIAQRAPTPLDQLPMVYDNRRNSLLLVRSCETWEWRGLSSGWDLIDTSNLAVGDANAMAYDSVREVAVMFTCDVYSNPRKQATNEWNGEMWVRRSSTGPSSRTGHAMAFDSIRGVTVMFAGLYGGSDTWEWDGNTWVQRSNTGPSARRLHAMAFDEVRGVVVMFGGFNEREFLGDTWEWDGVEWVERSAPGPSPRGYHTMMYDPARRVTVLHGGDTGPGMPSDEAWEWDGQVWTPVLSPGVPRRQHAMTFDSIRGVRVAHGGVDEKLQTTSETWEWFADCNCNDRPDGDDVDAGAPDCNGNRVPDDCDIERGLARDADANGVPDTCEPCSFLRHLKADCRANADGFQIRAVLKADLPPEAKLTICLDLLDCQTVRWGERARRRVVWAIPQADEHEVCVGDCSQGEWCASATCP
ncbi:MAG: hypothetical protein IT449_04610 [Phycisphaerales bacterium]|nr:hypothetical protein [Phycisphaerales bacterium]